MSRISRILQDEMGDPRPNPQNVQGKPRPNPQQAGGMGRALTAEGKAELGKLGAEKAGRVRDFLDRRRDEP